ncbi:MAG: LLM class flavin-dependent oxidoreductase [Gammaproteobacteria bacterium]|nr:LLM class flavin-dependent oxidoreductase [Gammaproteobacteria bacterium]
MKSIPWSLLDLAPVAEGQTPADAFRNARDLAQHAERWGYRRYWLAEHHNMPGIASAATSVVVGHVAAGTSTIRVGAGGIMLPNHSPLAIAEQFGTLETLFPGRIDLAVGRAPGSDQITARALRRDPMQAAERFPDDVQELLALFAPVQPGQRVQAVPGGGLGVPVWILGSSLFGAQLAAALGLPYAFASHFAPEALLDAVALYRRYFTPSPFLAKPHVMPCVGVFIAQTDAEAQRLFSTAQQQFTNLFRGAPGKLQPPRDDMDSYWTPGERAGVERMLHYACVGSRETAGRQLWDFIAATEADEIMLTAQIHDHRARLRSFELAAEILEECQLTRQVRYA